MLFAAGLGTRLRPHTNVYPKPVIPLMGIPLGYYLFPYLQQLSVSNIVVNTFHLPEQVHRLYKDLNFMIQFSDEKKFIKGSGGGLKQAEKLLSPETLPIIVCNSDEVIFTKENNFLTNAIEKHQSQHAYATLVVMKHPLAGTKFGAIWVDPRGRVVHIGKDAPAAVNVIPWHFVGLQILSSRVLQKITLDVESNIFYDVLIHQLQHELVQIYPIDADWFETGNITDYVQAKKEIAVKLENLPHYENHFKELNKLPRSQISDLA